MHAHAHRRFLAALAQPPATESGFGDVENDVRLFYQRFGTGTPTVFISNRLGRTPSFATLHDGATSRCPAARRTVWDDVGATGVAGDRPCEDRARGGVSRA